MQPLRGTKDILPNESIIWQHVYNEALKILTLSNYHEIRTPILEPKQLFTRSIGIGTDIVNKEMYTFTDLGQREIALRPEGTACIARAFISNKMYLQQSIQRLWYWGPMFRYERPQNGRQRQFHQLGIECIGSLNPIADVEVIRLATTILNKLQCSDYNIEINSIGSINERQKYKEDLVTYLSIYHQDLDVDSQNKLLTNPLKILDSKNVKTQDILNNAPVLNNYLSKESQIHFDILREHLEIAHIDYSINNKLVRGLDYYNNTAFEIKTQKLGSQDTICGGGRYDMLIEQLGGPSTPSVGWAIGIERLILLISNNLNISYNAPYIYIAIQGAEAAKKIWQIIYILEQKKIRFCLDLNSKNFQKQVKKAHKAGAKLCLILGEEEVINKTVTLKWLNSGLQKSINLVSLSNVIQEILYS